MEVIGDQREAITFDVTITVEKTVMFKDQVVGFAAVSNLVKEYTFNYAAKSIQFSITEVNENDPRECVV